MRCGSALPDRFDDTSLDPPAGARDRRPKPAAGAEPAAQFAKDFDFFLEDETQLASNPSTPPRVRTERPPIADVGFAKRGAPSDRATTDPAPFAPEAWPPSPRVRTQPQTVPPTRRVQRTKLPPSSSLDADTDEGVVQVPPDLPPFAPSAPTRPATASIRRPPEKRRPDLLENKPVTGAKPPPRGPRPNEETPHGTMIPHQGGETIAAPGELAGLRSRLPVRPELVDDLLSPVGVGSDGAEPIDGFFLEKERHRGLDAAPPDDLRRLKKTRLPTSERTDPEDTREVLPPLRLEETRAFVGNPLTHIPIDGDSELLPLVEDTAKNLDARAAGEAEVRLRLASGTRRILALLIDGVVVLSLVVVPGLFGVFGERLTTAHWLDPDDVGVLLIEGELTIPLLLLAVIIVLFSALSHGLTGRSLGKLVCGLEVVRKKTGARIRFPRALIRSVLSLSSVLLGGAGYLWLIVDRRARTFHDYLTGTVVVVASSRNAGNAG